VKNFLAEHLNKLWLCIGAVCACGYEYRERIGGKMAKLFEDCSEHLLPGLRPREIADGYTNAVTISDVLTKAPGSNRTAKSVYQRGMGVLQRLHTRRLNYGGAVRNFGFKTRRPVIKP